MHNSKIFQSTFSLCLMLALSLKIAFAQGDLDDGSAPQTAPLRSMLLSEIKAALIDEVGTRFNEDNQRVKLNLVHLSVQTPTVNKMTEVQLSDAVKQEIPYDRVTHYEFKTIKASDCEQAFSDHRSQECAVMVCQVANRQAVVNRKAKGSDLRTFYVYWDNQGHDDFVDAGVGVTVVDDITGEALSAYCVWSWHET